MPDTAAGVAVAVLDGQRVVAPLAERTGFEVVATGAADHHEVVATLVERAALVIGIATTPWPQRTDLHAEVSERVPAYRGVVAWHGSPLLLDALAQAAANGVAGGAHLLVTAPDPGQDARPEELTFLREVAEQVAARTSATARSIAWRGDSRTPTAVDALTSLLTVHGKRDVLELPVAPGTSADPRLLAVAEEHGGRLTTVDLRAELIVEVLTGAVRTVVAAELPVLDPSAAGAAPAGEGSA